MKWIAENWALIGLILMIADKYVTKSKCKWDDLIFTAVKQSLCAVVGKKLPIVFIAIGMAAQFAVIAPGCAVKTISMLSPRDQAMATVDLMIDEYTDMHAAYLTALPTLTAERQSWCHATLAPVMNIAKRSIKLASDAAIGWKLTEDTNATSTCDAYIAALAEARSALDDAISLYQEIKGETE